MTVGVQAFRGERLKEARLARGLFKKSLADMIGVTGWAITKYEDGDDKPQQDKVDALATHLAFPREFFFVPAWPETLDPVLWRSRASETKSAREMTEQRMRWLCELFSFLEEEVDFPATNLPDFNLSDDPRQITPEQVERVALDLRRHWGLRQMPIPDMALALENAGIPVVALEISSDKQDGVSFWSNRLKRFFVGINTYNVSASRARFDAAHELGHAALHANVTSQQSRDPAMHKIMEQQAHRFAAAFLFPKEAFLAEVGAVSLDYFSDLKKRWGMSIAAMIFRAYDLGLIDDVDRASLYQNMTRRRWRGPLREPFDSHTDMPLERPRMLRRGVEAIMGAGIYGAATIKSALPLPAREIEQLAGLDEAALTTGEVIQLATPKANRSLRTVDLESGTIVEFPQRRTPPI
jgi:Zn-dependent peptidase ImmA (M78 family)/transcriptional regulator with XRE-family HTH domain